MKRAEAFRTQHIQNGIQELPKSIRRKLEENINNYNKKVVESATENGSIYEKAKRTRMIGKNEIIALAEDDIRTTNNGKYNKVL